MYGSANVIILHLDKISIVKLIEFSLIASE